SSRRRHTRFSRDWSSDVCSSDLGLEPQAHLMDLVAHHLAHHKLAVADGQHLALGEAGAKLFAQVTAHALVALAVRHREAVKIHEIGRASCRGRVWSWGVEGTGNR